MPTYSHPEGAGDCFSRIESTVFPASIESKSYAKHWSFLTFFYILTIILVFLILWNFFGIQKGTKEGESCDKDDECEAGTFCSGSQTCQKGNSGKGSGAVCGSTDECDINHQCINGTCRLKTPS